MIKICRGVYIHFTTILLFVFCYLNRNLEIAAISYFSVFIHEMAHTLSAVLLGVRPSHIVLMPFGVNLKLKNSFLYSISDEILLYASGPLCSAVLCLVSAPFSEKNEYVMLFFLNNMALFFFNILPILPLDGGIIAKKLLAYMVGNKRAEKILRGISIILIFVLIFLQGYIILKRERNFSALFSAIFLTGNLFLTKEKYYTDLAKELLLYKRKDKKIRAVKGYAIKADAELRELIKNFSPKDNYIIFKENQRGEVDEILTERQVIETVLK